MAAVSELNRRAGYKVEKYMYWSAKMPKEGIWV